MADNGGRNRSHKERERKASPLGVAAAVLVVIGGHVGILIAIAVVVVMLIYKQVTQNKESRSGGTAVHSTPPPRRRPQPAQERPQLAKEPARRHTAQTPPPRPAAHRSARPEINGAHQLRSGKTHRFRGNIGLSRAKQLEQLEVLLGAGLYTQEEYKQKKRRILRETEP